MADISKITIPDGLGGTLTYDIKDSIARAAIDAGLSFNVSTDAATTPAGVVWEKEGVLITGTLVASESIKGIYLVPSSNAETKDTYDEYVVVKVSSSSYIWERLGNTEIDFSNLASYLYTTVTTTKDEVLGSGTTFTNSPSSVSFFETEVESFIQSYPGGFDKLQTATIKGVGADTTFLAVNTNSSVTATNTVFGTDTTASKIVTENKTATNTVLGTATSASKVTVGESYDVPVRDGTSTNISYVGNSSTNSLLESATVSNETLILGAVSVSQGSVRGVSASSVNTINRYTFDDVTVPVITSNSSVSVASVKTNTDVVVPVVTSNNSVTATNTTTTSKTAATSAANATTVATGSLDSTDTVGATVMVALGVPTTGTAVVQMGTATAAAQTITVGNNDLVNSVTGVTVTIENRE